MQLVQRLAEQDLWRKDLSEQNARLVREKEDLVDELAKQRAFGEQTIHRMDDELRGQGEQLKTVHALLHAIEARDLEQAAKLQGAIAEASDLSSFARKSAEAAEQASRICQSQQALMRPLLDAVARVLESAIRNFPDTQGSSQAKPANTTSELRRHGPNLDTSAHLSGAPTTLFWTTRDLLDKMQGLGIDLTVIERRLRVCERHLFFVRESERTGDAGVKVVDACLDCIAEALEKAFDFFSKDHNQFATSYSHLPIPSDLRVPPEDTNLMASLPELREELRVGSHLTAIEVVEKCMDAFDAALKAHAHRASARRELDKLVCEKEQRDRNTTITVRLSVVQAVLTVTSVLVAILACWASWAAFRR